MTKEREKISQEMAQELVQRQIGFVSTKEPSRSALYAEALRYVLWFYWQQDQQPMHVTRLLNMTERLLLPYPQDEESRRALLRELLDVLADIGDITSLPGGKWLPAPFRYIELQNLDRVILLGALPVKYMSGDLRAQVTLTGVARTMTREKLSNICHSLDIRQVSEQEWLSDDLDNSDLRDWTKTQFNNVKWISASNIDLEIYAPAFKKIQLYLPQFFRWIKPKQELANGKYLARHSFYQGQTSYYFIEFEQGQITKISSDPVTAYIIRRLMYGLDLYAENPTRIKIEPYQGQTKKIIISSELPRAETRLLLTLGEEIKNQEENKYYPRIWKIQEECLRILAPRLEKLGIQIL